MDISNTKKRGRPSKTEQGYSKTRIQLLRAGVIFLTQKGFSTTGIDEILKSVNIPKGSFYHFFKNKEVFGLEIIDIYADYFNKKLNSFFNNHTLSPLDRLKAFCLSAENGMQKYNYDRGCLVGNLGQEMALLPTSLITKIINTLTIWEQLTQDCLQEAKNKKEIDETIDCRHMAHIFWIGWEGAILRAKLEKKSEPLSLFRDYFIKSISYHH